MNRPLRAAPGEAWRLIFTVHMNDFRVHMNDYR